MWSRTVRERFKVFVLVRDGLTAWCMGGMSAPEALVGAPSVLAMTLMRVAVDVVLKLSKRCLGKLVCTRARGATTPGLCCCLLVWRRDFSCHVISTLGAFYHVVRTLLLKYNLRKRVPSASEFRIEG